MLQLGISVRQREKKLGKTRARQSRAQGMDTGSSLVETVQNKHAKKESTQNRIFGFPPFSLEKLQERETSLTYCSSVSILPMLNRFRPRSERLDAVNELRAPSPSPCPRPLQGSRSSFRRSRSSFSSVRTSRSRSPRSSRRSGAS